MELIPSTGEFLYNGTRIVANSLIPEIAPKLELRFNLTCCSEKFRLEFNAWLLETFGTNRPIYFYDDNTIFTHPKTRELMRRALRERTRPNG